MNDKEKLFVSVIVPCLNEERQIAKCLDSLLTSDYPHDLLEILVIDGGSSDKTREIVEEFSRKSEVVKLLENPHRYTPFAYNIGIRNARGDAVAIMSAHAAYPEDYLSKCAKYLVEYDADNVGGVLLPKPQTGSLFNKALSLVLTEKFGSGGAAFRGVTGDQPREVDTLFGGFYRKDVFDRIGMFNEHLIRNQDMDINTRLTRAGGKILLFPDIECVVYDSRYSYSKFVKKNFANGMWTILPYRYSSNPLKARHVIPGVFVSGLVVGGFLSIFSAFIRYLYFGVLGLYFGLNTYYSAKVARREKNIRLFPMMFLVFPSRHISQGLGVLKGLLRLVTGK